MRNLALLLLTNILIAFPASARAQSDSSGKEASTSIYDRGAESVIRYSESRSRSELSARLNNVIDRAISEKRIVGTVIIVSNDGKIIYRRAAGYADREAKTLMRENNLFRLASMTKPIVSAAALSLAQHGLVDLDAPVTKYLPDFRPKLQDGTEPKITVRQLLTHTSGLNYSFMEPEDGPYHKANVSDGLDQPGLSIKDNLRRLSSCPLLFEPGTKWNYSLSTDVLGAVLESATQGPLNKVVLKYVTRPLQMNDTSFTVSDKSRLAVPYVDGKPEPTRMKNVELVPFGVSKVRFEPDRVFNKRSYPSGGGGLVGTADDYMKFLEAVRTANGAFLNPDSIKLLTENQISSLTMENRPGWKFTCCAAILVDPKEARSNHSVRTIRWGGIYGHSWFVDPAQKLSVVQLTNTTLEGTKGAFPDEVINAVYGEAR